MTSYSQCTDNELADLLTQGSESAFSEIYSRYWDKLFVMATKRLDDEFEGGEVVQDIFCNLWRKRSNFQLVKGFSNYFAIAVKFEVINKLAKRNRQVILKKEFAQNSSEVDNSAAERIEFDDLKKHLEKSVKNLPEKCQIVFRLKHDQGYSQKQIAAELSLSEKTVEAHLSKARKQIKLTFGKLAGLLIILYFA